MERIGQAAISADARERYENQCAVCDIKEGLQGAHISGWGNDEDNRANMANVICFCGHHHIIFDRGYFVIDDKFNILFSILCDHSMTLTAIRNVTLEKLRMPKRGIPDIRFLGKHRAQFPSKNYS